MGSLDVFQARPGEIKRWVVSKDQDDTKVEQKFDWFRKGRRGRQLLSWRKMTKRFYIFHYGRAPRGRYCLNTDPLWEKGCGNESPKRYDSTDGVNREGGWRNTWIWGQKVPWRALVEGGYTWSQTGE